MAIDLKDTVLGSIVELAECAVNPEINPCFNEAKPESCDYGDCANCPFQKDNAILLKKKTDTLHVTAQILGISLEEALESLLESQEAEKLND